MAVIHLTDEQIQRYLDGDVSHESEVAHHLKKCAACQRELLSYRKVYEGLKQDIGFELSPGFAKSVMSRLATTTEASSRVSLDVLILIILGSITTVGAALYFMDSSLTAMLRDFTIGMMDFGSSLVESLKAATAGLNVSMDVVLFTGLILLTFAALDRILLWSRGRHFCL